MFLTLFHTVNSFELITETIPVWRMRNKQCVIFQFKKRNSNSYKWQQNTQLPEVQELPVPQQMNHKQVTWCPAEIKMDHTPFPALINTEDIFSKLIYMGRYPFVPHTRNRILREIKRQ